MTEMRKLNSQRLAVLAAVGLALVAGGAAAGFWLGARQPTMGTAEGEKKVLYWYDPMVPDQHFDKPGKSPFMDMQLVPRYEGEGGAAPGVRIDPGEVQSLGVRIAPVERTRIKDAITASGVIAFNERDVAIVQVKRSGFVERSHRRAVGDIVRAGAPLVDLRVPDWTGALAEYLVLRKSGDAELAAAAKRRLAMLGVPAETVSEAEASGAAPPAFTIRAPTSGALTSFDIREGMAIEPGASIATINGLSPVWLTASVPQGKAGQLRSGASANAKLTAFPGEKFVGRVEMILPAVSVQSRTVEVRVVLPNPDNRLRPGMSGEVELSNAAERSALVVPSEAVIRTGRRTVVIAVNDDNRFSPTEVEIGLSTGDRTEIASGLVEGQRIVASGQFLIDSEASLAGAVSRLQGGSAQAAATYSATGRVTAVSDAGVTISHTPVPQLSWPAMTMQFDWGPDGKKTIAVGDEVSFAFKKGGAGYVIETIERARSGR
jgi:Cu(I)/Ag(I) efflux system membrane fusion protein